MQILSRLTASKRKKGDRGVARDGDRALSDRAQGVNRSGDR
jgi:hypothetical protein